MLVSQRRPEPDVFVGLIPDPTLGGFDQLPPSEQSVRARIYCAVLVWSGNPPFAFAVAMDRSPEVLPDMREWLASVGDAWILEGLRTEGLDKLRGSL